VPAPESTRASRRERHGRVAVAHDELRHEQREGQRQRQEGQQVEPQVLQVAQQHLADALEATRASSW
jgi:hypothetical protein